jgi:hypothetical protein
MRIHFSFCRKFWVSLFFFPFFLSFLSSLFLDLLSVSKTLKRSSLAPPPSPDVTQQGARSTLGLRHGRPRHATEA